MAQKKKSKVVQMTSPENYIRNRARSLPIHECWINSDWNDQRLAQVYVARKHTNQNLTLGLYLVDLNCLGIKDSHYFFNISELEYAELIEHAKTALDMVQTNYLLAHNVVFAGLDYAEDLGFKPHKDFKLSKFILDDDDDTEIMDIECGTNGMPHYIQGPSETPAKSAQIIAHLEKAVGKGNFNFTYGLGEDEDFDDLADLDDELPYTEADIMSSKTFQFKIQLDNISNPTVWRRITVPSYYTFSDLHFAIQVAFGWENAHLYQFSPKGYGSSPTIQEVNEDTGSGFFTEEELDSEETQLSEIFTKEKQKYTYTYDFGDDWVHQITLEKIIPEITQTPALLAGKGKCPPEDCGGPWGFENLKSVLSNPKNPEYEELAEWYGEDSFDADAFDIKKALDYFNQIYNKG